MSPIPFAWHIDHHFAVPRLLADPGLPPLGRCRAVRFAGPDWQGRPSSVFAWLALPEDAGPDHPVPGVVLAHGGLGTAFADWVRLWVDRGYAAIAIDHGGCLPIRDGETGYRRLQDGGPLGCGGFEQCDLPAEDRWNHHAVANLIRAHSLLRSLPEVDESRIALTGISWGGYLTCLGAALDIRFACAVAVYGCGFLDRSPIIGPRIAERGAAAAAEWLALWDPQHHLTRVTLPICFVNGTGDRHFIPPIWSASTSLPRGAVTRSLQVGLGHSHGQGWAPLEIAAFIDGHCRGGTLPPSPGRITRQDGALVASVDGAERVAACRLWWTADTGPWPERHWRSVDARRDDAGRLHAPSHGRAAFFEVEDQFGRRSSSTVWMEE